MHNTRKTKIIIKHSDGSKFQLTAQPDTTVDDWVIHFETMMSFIGFVPSQIEEIGEAMKLAYSPELENVVQFPSWKVADDDEDGFEDHSGHDGAPC